MAPSSVAPPGPLWRPVLAVGLFAAVVAAVVTASVLDYRAEQMAQAERILTTTLEDTISSLDAWFVRGEQDARITAAQTGLGERYVRYRAGTDPSLPAFVTDRLTIERDLRGYACVRLYDTDGTLAFVAQRETECDPGHDSAAEAAVAAVETGEPAYVEGVSRSETAWHVAWAAPVRAAGGGEPVAVVAYVGDLVAAMPQLMQQRPLPYDSGDISAVRADDDGYLIMRSSAAFAPQRVDSVPGCLAANAGARDGEIIVRHGPDHAGTQVVAASSPWRGGEWLIVSRVDRSDVIAPVWRFAALTGVAGACVIVAAGLIAALFRRQTARRYAEFQAHCRTSEALEMRERFLANVTHEFRTPLNSIIGFTSLLSQGYSGPVTPEQERQLGIIAESAQRLLALVDDILDLSKLRASAAHITPSEFTVREVGEYLQDLLAPLASRKGLVCDCELIDPDEVLVTDRPMVERVLLNLLSNAIKFTDEGSVALTAESHDDDVLFMVADTGRGIPPEDVDRVMEDFHQVIEPGGVKPVGTGLGLAISRRMAQALGGDLHVTSVVGVGTTFLFRVPRVYQPPVDGAAQV